ncbi:C4-dicarboxylate transport transcriptional regulatory protein DctD [Candidatus Nitrosocosmicus oleophilus]|uniref:C4-dicarboxylate transport transcriptional regulatory protein DctD n=1 Tax=Candidatus Nitrosocosmicus oleophilus TaxID=1353260 RepID=A0A654M2G9_9ARCH|nr:response regulator [Candidatus Nitrosocosmicus oleophilus]ALI37200.1 C4-dicarboxylate transport transcriptional regulatory protein DctD [Candidatus Nitrosocosmicus oleophilus]
MSHRNPGASYNRIGEPSIAIIDDEKDLLFVYKKALELQRLKVVTFDDSSVALNELKVRYKKYSMILVDIRMPKVNGYQLINEIKRIDPSIKTILMSAYDVSDLEVHDNLNDGVKIDRIMHKPFSLIKLISTVKTLLEK